MYVVFRKAKLGAELKSLCKVSQSLLASSAGMRCKRAMCGMATEQTAVPHLPLCGLSLRTLRETLSHLNCCSAENPSAIPPTSAQLVGAGSRDGASVGPEGVCEALLTPNTICINGLCHFCINTCHKALNPHN